MPTLKRYSTAPVLLPASYPGFHPLNQPSRPRWPWIVAALVILALVIL